VHPACTRRAGEFRGLVRPDVQEKNRTFDYDPTGLDPKHSAARLKENRERWAGVVQRAGITAN